MTPRASYVLDRAPPAVRPPAEPSGAAPLLADVRQLAGRLGVSARHIERLDAAGKLPVPIRLGRAKRWNVAEIQAWIDAGAPDRAEWIARKGGGRG